MRKILYDFFLSSEIAKQEKNFILINAYLHKGRLLYSARAYRSLMATCCVVQNHENYCVAEKISIQKSLIA